ncbi:hypothetical protein ER308_19415 [Egibacter rhizosphaerae]|uniref:Type 4a pilus biogenesis protein PilO n=1 Tax=Egibacter rhizosphaerae TaxID=1670831 RepID=A0A411YJZ3_9ACTN|nr:type 4a pilus biogenesis protein PilO [Egibacter rhizosphaerae]QBI21524.1 hypothetical protein ER308_19415 [Egibacter rhizosphaerae]
MRTRAPIIAGLLAVALGAGFWFFLYQPQTENREEIEEETAQLEAEAGQLRNEIAHLREIKENEIEYEARLARLEEYVPHGVQQPSALREFQQTADSAGVEISDLSFGDPVAVEDAPDTGEPETTLAEINVSMSLQGGYFQLVDLLRRLEVDVARALLVDSVNLTEGEDGFPDLRGTWNGRMFAVVDIASAGDPGEEGAGDLPDLEDGDELDEDELDDADEDGDAEPDDLDNEDDEDEEVANR